jgi:hypothetical protein
VVIGAIILLALIWGWMSRSAKLGWPVFWLVTGSLIVIGYLASEW